MYFPYLRARQFELIALRELVNEGALQNTIIPILEPVKESFNNLNLAHAVFEEHDYKAYLIVNPLNGEMKGDRTEILRYISENKSYKPAFIYKNNNKYIEQCINDFGLEDCLIVCFDNICDEEELKVVLKNSKISNIMMFEPHKFRNLDRFIKKLNKFYIRLDDVFEKQQKNADFLSIQAHKLTEEHLFYKDDGYQGFSDFTVLPSEFIEGGSTPRAVVIHLSYINSDSENQIWIRHFTSDTNDSISDVQGKFAEAATKAIDFCKKLPLNNSATIELTRYLDEGRYPGLGTVKKISIKNHLTIVCDYLNLKK